MRSYTFAAATDPIAYLYTITRKDEEVIRLTSWQQAIKIGDDIWEPAVGLTAFDISERNDATPASTQLSFAAYNGGSIDPDDVMDGLYAEADVEIDLCNPDNPTARDFHFYGRIGGTSKPVHGAVTFEVRNPYAMPRFTLVPTFTLMCRFAFGDAFCGVDIEALQSVCEIASVTDRHAIVLTTLPTPSASADGWYAPGKFMPTMGRNKNRVFPIGLWTAATLTATTYLPVGALCVVGDTALIWPDCNKTLAMCRDKYDNARRHGGFPHFAGAKAASQAGG